LSDDLIFRREVKPFGSRGGAYVSVPASLIGKTVTIIDETKAGKIEVHLSVLTTEFVKVNVDKNTKAKKALMELAAPNKEAKHK
jgi:hypothetical protein